MPTRARFSPASQRGAHSNSATWPVSKRFSSSGMDRSPERSPAFYRGHGNPPLAAHQGARQSIIDVINPRYPIGLQLRDHKLKRHHDPPCLLSMGARDPPQVAVGLQQCRVLEKYLRRGKVALLAGVIQYLIKRCRVTPQCPHAGSNLHDVEPCPYDMDDIQASISRIESSWNYRQR